MRVKRVLCAVGAAGVFGVVLVAGAAPAGAELDGPCEARGEFVPAEGADGPDEPFTVDAATASGVIEIPDEADVNWLGAIDSGEDTGPRETSGSIEIKLPPVIDSLLGSVVEIEPWGDDDATSTQETGTEDYEIPGWIPPGAEIVVSGSHSDELGNCSGSVTLSLSGSALSDPVTLVLLALTAGSGALLFLAAKP